MAVGRLDLGLAPCRIGFWCSVCETYFSGEVHSCASGASRLSVDDRLDPWLLCDEDSPAMACPLGDGGWRLHQFEPVSFARHVSRLGQSGIARRLLPHSFSFVSYNELDLTSYGFGKAAVLVLRSTFAPKAIG